MLSPNNFYEGLAIFQALFVIVTLALAAWHFIMGRMRLGYVHIGCAALLAVSAAYTSAFVGPAVTTITVR